MKPALTLACALSMAQMYWEQFVDWGSLSYEERIRLALEYVRRNHFDILFIG